MNEILHINCTCPWSGWDLHGIWALLKPGAVICEPHLIWMNVGCWMCQTIWFIRKWCLLLENETTLVSQMQSNYHSSRIQDRIWMNVSISTYEISFIITSVVGKKKKIKRSRELPKWFSWDKKGPKSSYFLFDFWHLIVITTYAIKLH